MSLVGAGPPCRLSLGHPAFLCAQERHRQPPRKEMKGDVGTPAPPRHCHPRACRSSVLPAAHRGPGMLLDGEVARHPRLPALLPCWRAGKGHQAPAFTRPRCQHPLVTVPLISRALYLPFPWAANGAGKPFIILTRYQVIALLPSKSAAEVLLTGVRLLTCSLAIAVSLLLTWFKSLLAEQGGLFVKHLLP